MFEVGKMVKRIKIDPRISRDWDCAINGVVTVDEILPNKKYSELITADCFHAVETDRYYLQSDFEPIGSTPAPRMVTTCDIGARVVRVKINPDMSSDWECPIGKTVTVKSLGPCKTFEAIETGLSYYLSDFVLADEQPKKEAEYECERCGKRTSNAHICIPKDKQLGKDPAQEYAEQLGKLYQESIDERVEKITVDVFKKAVNTLKDLVVKHKSDDEGTDKTPPDPSSGIASVMFGSKPRLMYGSLAQIQGPTKDEEARNARTEEERKRYEGR